MFKMAVLIIEWPRASNLFFLLKSTNKSFHTQIFRISSYAYFTLARERKRSAKSPKCIWIFNKFQDFILDFPSVPFSFQIFVFKTTLYIRVAHSEQRLGLFESTILCKITLRCKVLSNKITMFIQKNLIFRYNFAQIIKICFAKEKMDFTLKYESSKALTK